MTLNDKNGKKQEREQVSDSIIIIKKHYEDCGDLERVREREIILKASRDDGTAEERFNRMELPIMLKANLSRKTDY